MILDRYGTGSKKRVHEIITEKQGLLKTRSTSIPKVYTLVNDTMQERFAYGQETKLMGDSEAAQQVASFRVRVLCIFKEDICLRSYYHHVRGTWDVMCCVCYCPNNRAAKRLH
jgi:hypothetical protein